MSVALIRSRFAQQPQQIVEVSPEFIDYRPFSVIVPAVGARNYDLWNRKWLTRGSGSSTSINAFGRANKSSGAANFDAGGGFKLLNSGSKDSRYAVICVIATTDTTSDRFAFSYANSGSSYFGLRATGSSTSMKIAWTEGNNITYTVPAWADGKPHVIALISYWNNDKKIFIDGILVATQSTGVGANSTPYTNISLGGLNRSSLELPLACEISLLAGFDLPIPASRVMELSGSRVWELFARKRIWSPGSSAPTLPTLSAATYMPGSLTSRGFRPRVTAS